MINILTRSVHAFRELAHNLGWLNGCLYAVDWLLSKWLKGYFRLYRYYLVAQPVCETPLLPPGRGKKIEIRLIDETDIVTRQFPRPQEVIQSRFRQGAKCLVAFKEGKFIGYLWLLSGTYYEDEVRAAFSPLPKTTTVWDFDVYIAPESRIGFAFPRLWDEANRFLADNGVKWSCSRISAFNAGSINSHARLGTRILNTATFLCAGRLQLMIATGAPYFHLSFRPDSRPTIQIDTNKNANRSVSLQTN
jgi:hypothetical protein